MIIVDPAAHHDPRPWVQLAVLMAGDGFTGSAIAEMVSESDLVVTTYMVYEALDPGRRRRAERARPEHPKCIECRTPMTYQARPGAICRKCRYERAHANDERIAELWQAGWRGDDIADEVGMTSKQVSSRVWNIRKYHRDLDRRRA